MVNSKSTKKISYLLFLVALSNISLIFLVYINYQTAINMKEGIKNLVEKTKSGLEKPTKLVNELGQEFKKAVHNLAELEKSLGELKEVGNKMSLTQFKEELINLENILEKLKEEFRTTVNNFDRSLDNKSFELTKNLEVLKLEISTSIDKFFSEICCPSCQLPQESIRNILNTLPGLSNQRSKLEINEEKKWREMFAKKQLALAFDIKLEKSEVIEKEIYEKGLLGLSTGKIIGKNKELENKSDNKTKSEEEEIKGREIKDKEDLDELLKWLKDKEYKEDYPNPTNCPVEGIYKKFSISLKKNGKCLKCGRFLSLINFSKYNSQEKIDNLFA